MRGNELLVKLVELPHAFHVGADLLLGVLVEVHQVVLDAHERARRWGSHPELAAGADGGTANGRLVAVAVVDAHPHELALDAGHLHGGDLVAALVEVTHCGFTVHATVWHTEPVVAIGLAEVQRGRDALGLRPLLGVGRGGERRQQWRKHQCCQDEDCEKTCSHLICHFLSGTQQ